MHSLQCLGILISHAEGRAPLPGKYIGFQFPFIKMLQSKGYSAAAKMLQTSVKNGAVINNAIKIMLQKELKKTFGL